LEARGVELVLTALGAEIIIAVVAQCFLATCKELREEWYLVTSFYLVRLEVV